MLSHRSLILAPVTCHPRETFVMSMKSFNYVMYDLFRRRQKKKMEDKLTIVMSFIAAEVKKKSCDELSRLRLVAKPCPEGNQNIALFCEVWNEIKSPQVEIAESEALQTSKKTKGLKGLLTQLQNLTTKDARGRI